MKPTPPWPPRASKHHRYKPPPFIVYIVVKCMYAYKNPKIHTTRSLENKNKNTREMGTTQRYEIIREVIEPPTNTHKFSQTNSILILNYFVSLTFQDNDQDMADSSSSTTNKRRQLTVHQPIQQKKNKK
jgi:hypothetical protein